MSQPVIDVWMQHPTPRFLSQPFFDSLKRWTGNLQDTEVPLDMTLHFMEEANVTKGLIAAWVGPQGPLISNEEVHASVQQYPDRLCGLASVNLFDPMSGVRELRRCVKELGFKGLRIVPWLWGLPPDDRRYYPLYAECIELDIPFCTQIGHTGPLLSSEPGRPIPYLENVAIEFPELKIVAGHLGAPWTQEAISMAHKFPNFYIDTSAYKASRFPEEFALYMKKSDCKKVLFGSNYPMLTPQGCLEALNSLELSEQAQSRFLHDNAAALFKLRD